MAVTEAIGSAACAPPGLQALHALMAAALLLPGVAVTDAHAQSGDGLALQSARVHEAARPGDGLSPPGRGLTVDSHTLRATRTLDGGRHELQLGYTHDTWSGATPVSTAPVAAGTNRPLQRGGVGQLVTVGASPMINGRVLLDAQGRPLRRDAASGRLLPAPELVHTLASASPETRQQLEARLTRRLVDGSLSLGGGVSIERDHQARFVHLQRRFDDGAQTFTLGVNATRARIAAVLDHDAAPYITRSAYAAQIENVAGQLLWHGRRDELGLAAGWVRALDPGTLAEATLSLTHSRGDLCNPYRVTSVIFAPPAAAPDGVRDGDLRALLEQRPRRHRQWNAGMRLVLHHEASDGALHLGAGLFGDDWGQRGQRLQVQWMQPLAEGALASLGLRHHSQGAARFFRPYLVSAQAWRQTTITPDGQLLAREFDRALLPAHFSSDPRLAAFGSITAAAGWTQRWAGGVELDLSLERSLQSGRLRWGGNGEGRHADLRGWTAQATLKLPFELGSGHGTRGAAAAHEHAAPGHDPLPAEVMALAHASPGRGRLLLGLHHRSATQSGTLREGTSRVTDATLSTRGCGGSPCRLAPTAMAMRMQMIDLVLGLDERWSLMLMPQWMVMRMDTRLLPGAVAGDTPLHLGRHETSAPGDTQAHLLRHGSTAQGAQWVMGLGLGAPTGRTTLAGRRMHQHDGALLDIGMQTGSGTWELLPSATLRGAQARWSWGLQFAATMSLQSSNDQGYARGHRWQASGWTGWRATPALAATARLGWRVDRGVSGSARDATPADAPTDLGANLGGRFVETGFGLHHAGGAGMLALERVQPLWSELRGTQLPPRSRWALSWHMSL